jgi:uncharacterized protein YigE (DUF2233 family)
MYLFEVKKPEERLARFARRAMVAAELRRQADVFLDIVELQPKIGRAPNGIFYLSADRAAVAETGAFLKQRARAELATQSGPMLVINGRVHPRFNRRSTSLKARNGVWSAASF